MLKLQSKYGNTFLCNHLVLYLTTSVSNNLDYLQFFVCFFVCLLLFFVWFLFCFFFFLFFLFCFFGEKEFVFEKFQLVK